MAKNKREIKFYYIFLSILLILSICVITYLILYNKDTLKKEQKLNKELLEILNEKEKEFTTIKKTNKDLIEQINKLNNIDGITKNTKEEVFSLAKELENQILNGNTNYKIAYLTFDDGPYYLTHSYLSVLDKYGVKATFFTIGQDKDRCFDNRSQDCSIMYKKIVDAGHTIANHTYSHSIFGSLYTSTYNFMTQINKQHDLIKTRTGVEPNIMRFPGGSATARGLKNSIITEL